MKRPEAPTIVRWLVTLAVLQGAAAAPPHAPPEGERWLRIDYAPILDGRQMTHTGEPVTVILQRLSGRPMPTNGEGREDALAHAVLDPLVEPYAFVLADALDSLAPPRDPPMVEVGALWETGEAQPAWVELARARRFLLESDGEGHLRACLPAASLGAFQGDVPAEEDPVAAAQEAWDAAWPVLRHALAGERRRLQRLKGGEPPELAVEVHAYRHLPARSVFDLGVRPWRTVVKDTGSRGDRPPVDLAGWQRILDRGLTLEGARLDGSGRVRLFASETETKPMILGRPPTLADLAVAYRAIAHGGSGEPFMSLDRAAAPHVANVNYGGRLRDTALGMVSLLSDVRFKTFSLGIDLLGEGDAREMVRRAVPGFRTHLERFAADPSAGAVLNQQTRFWFYPDDVDLTLSEEGDVLAFRKVRMSAASEHVKDEGAAHADPAWTKDTVAFVNEHYDALATVFPEMAELDQSVRLLALFTWLEAAKARGLAVPDLDALLALELPALPTPRRFPELLSHDILPAPGNTGPVDVLDRTPVGDALDRLEPTQGRALPAAWRFSRDLAMLNAQIPDQAALAKEMNALAASAGADERDQLAYRAERLLMHARVLATIPVDRRASIEERRKQEPTTRVFSVGIGGVDLGMSSVLARAAGRGGRLRLAAGPRAAMPAAASPRAVVRTPVAAAADPPELPASPWPDHGLGPVAERRVIPLPDGAGSIVERRRSGALVRQGSFKSGSNAPLAWDEFVLAMEGPGARFRRRISVAGGASPVFERVEEGRFISYRFARKGNTLRAALALSPLPSRAFGNAKPPASPQASPLTLMDLPSPPGGLAREDAGEPPTVEIRLRSADGRERTATVPRALLQRLVRGRELDVTPDRPLQAFTPAAEVLGTSKAVMVLQSSDEARPPWSGAATVRPGEEDAARLASALTRWWSADPGASARAVVGVDAVESPARWVKAPVLDGTIELTAQATDWPAQAQAMRAGLQGLPSTAEGSKLVVVVSAESPGVLGRRLRALAVEPEMAGKIVAVASLGGPLRGDLPASLLGEGRLAAVGVFEAGPVGLDKAIDEVLAFAQNAASEASKGRRVEEIPGPFTWFY